MNQYKDRSYLSATEVAKYLEVTVKKVHEMTEEGMIPSFTAASGQLRYRIEDLKTIGASEGQDSRRSSNIGKIEVETGNTIQTIFIDNSQKMSAVDDQSVHLVITSPPYFNAKMYSQQAISGDLGNIHSLDQWYSEIGKVWEEVFRILQPGRKFFLNIMNLPIKDGKSFRTLNLVGRNIDLCEKIGFVFKRDIIWHKTNGVRAHFGTYPYPGGILLNNMHEFILEFNKPDDPKFKKYGHVTSEIRERSKLDKDFWLKLKNSDVWLISPEKSGDGRRHIAPFPVEIPNRLIRAYSFIEETVLDPFLGAGTTLKAAANLGRNGIGYEINEDIGLLAEQVIRNVDLANI